MMAAEIHQHGRWERLWKRILDGGSGALPDYELLELLPYLGKGRGGGMKKLVKTMLKRLGTFGDMLDGEPSRLKEFEGVGESLGLLQERAGD